jgi:hypothetical protein
MELEERAADPLAGGLMMGYQCGQLWGAALGAGAQAYRLFGAGPLAEARALIASQRIAESFRAKNKDVNCLEITQIDLTSPTVRKILTFILKSSVSGSCFGMAARTAHAAYAQINTTFSEEYAEQEVPIGAPAAPLSCSALLAHKMGLSDQQTVMAAGFAGGIGLSGSACGALGVAVWAIGMQDVREQVAMTGFKNPRVSDLTDGFVELSDYEYECSKIVGRKFEDVNDHAAYVQSGGCAKIIEGLAARRDGSG